MCQFLMLCELGAVAHCYLAPSASSSCQPRLFSGSKWKPQRAVKVMKKRDDDNDDDRSLRCRGMMGGRAPTAKDSATTTENSKAASTYTCKTTTDILLFESPRASFDMYLEDKPRVFNAIFPDKRRSQQLNEEEWRIQMLPIQFLFLTVYPVIDMRLRFKTRGREYLPGIPTDVAKFLELDIIRWELQGLDSVLEPSHFTLGVKGSLYPHRRGTTSRLKGQLEMNISFILPPMLSLIPSDVRQSVAESVLRGLVDNMKQNVNGSLLADYNKFKREHAHPLV